jgi:hypothetical protein
MHRRTWLLTGLTILAPISLVACGGASERISEEAAERAIEEAGGGNVEIDADSGEVKIETEDGSMTVDENGNMVIIDADGNVVTQSQTEDGATQVSTADGMVTTGSGELPEGWPAPELPTGFTVVQGTTISDSSSNGWTVVAGYEGAVTAACDALAASMSGWTPIGERVASGDSFCALSYENGQYTWQATVAADSGTTTAVINVITT